MSCTRPFRGFQVGVNPSGAPKYKLCSLSTDHVELVGDCWIPQNIPNVSRLARKVVRDYVMIPCGKCPDCRLSYAREWADRCMMEQSLHKSTLFLTLTYDDDHLPTTMYSSDDLGTPAVAFTLRKRDLQLFFKRLRKWADPVKIRYFACGEYGGRTFRPHYHCIVFGLNLPDLTWYKCGSSGCSYYNSDILQRLWPNGYAVVGMADYYSCAYVARYTLKKAFNDVKAFVDKFNVESEFIVSSRRPGIAAGFFRPSLYDFDSISVPTPSGVRSVYPPRYFDKLLDRVDHEKYNIVKASRIERASIKSDIVLRETDLDEIEYCLVREANTISKCKRLPRMEV